MSHKIIVIGDSRGRGVADYLKKQTKDFDVTEVILPGANIKKIHQILAQQIRAIKTTSACDIIALFIGGICSLTTKTVNREILYNGNDTVNTAKKHFQELWDFASENNIHIVTNTILPVDLKRANKNKTIVNLAEQQIKLNKDIEEINDFIINNIQVGSVLNAFKLVSYISVKKLGRKKTYKKKFRKFAKSSLFDGVHPNKELKLKINEKTLEHLHLVREVLNNKKNQSL